MTKAAFQRDHRIDFFRGIALAMIFVNHVPGNLWEQFTTRNFGFSDSAELFVFLAGFASAFAYGRPFAEGDRLLSTLRAWRRAGVLYATHAVLTLLAAGLFAWGALAFGDGRLVADTDVAVLLKAPMDGLFGLASMGHQLRYVNILPMYVVLLVMLPAMLAIVQAFGRTMMLIAAIALWTIAANLGLNMPNHPNEGGWFFNPFSWQLIFAIGLYCGLARREGVPALAFNPVLYTAALTFLLGAFLFVQFDLFGLERSAQLPVMVAGFDKTYVSLPRLLHLLALVYVFAHAPRGSVFNRIGAHNPLARLGRHSLPVFALGTVLALMLQVVKFERPVGVLADTTMIAGGLGLLFALAAFLDWWREAERVARSGRVSPAVPEPERPRALTKPQKDRIEPSGAGVLTAGPAKG